MTIKAARFITQLMAEIAERDARIAEQLWEITQLRRELGIVQEVANSALKAQKPSAGVADERAAFEAWYSEHYYEGDESCTRQWLFREPCGNYRHEHASRDWRTWQARARLDQPTASAGVVVGALVSALEGIVHDERVPNAVSQDYAALLIEARRLNHCRAQAVPDGWVMVPVEPTGEMEQFICNCDVRNGAITGDYPEWQQCYKAMLAAAPSTQHVAVVDCGDEGYWADILPNRSVHIGQMLYTAPPTTADAVSVPRELLERIADPFTNTEYLFEALRELRALLAQSESEVRP